MKKILVAILLVGLLVTPVLGDLVVLPPGPRLVTGYDFVKTHKLWNGIAVPLVGYNELAYCDVGLYTCVQETTPMVGISANVLNLLCLIPRVELKFREPFTLGASLSYNFRDGYWMALGYLSINLPLGGNK